MRYPDWQTRFWSALEKHRPAAFAFGRHDCVLFAATMADAISDADYVGRARDAFSWTDAREAALIIKGKNLAMLVQTVMGSSMRWQYMSMGDMVLIEDDVGEQSLCVHDGCQLLGPDKTGFKIIPMRYAVCGWRVI
jgi:hypothetical protein